MKSASENINGTSKAVLEGTKQVRTKLKRVWSRPGSVNKRNSMFHDETDDSQDTNRRQSLPVLPADDIFYKISFASPLDIGTQIKHWRGDFQSLDETRVRGDSETLDSETGSDVTSVADSSLYFYDGESDSLPPPSYPPPPLPSREDTSDVSSVSGSSYYTVGTIDARSFCEEVLDTVSRLHSLDLSPEKDLTRSQSWVFQGNNSSAYETVILPSLSVLTPTRPIHTPSPSSSELVSSESSSSHPPSTSILSSDYDNHRLRPNPPKPKSNPSYENWELDSARTEGDQETSSHSSSCPGESSETGLRHSQSVIFEFDPLFYFVDNLPKPPERVDSISEDLPQTRDPVDETPEGGIAQDLSEPLTASPSSLKKRLAWTNVKQALRNLTDTSARRTPDRDRRGSRTSELLIGKEKSLVTH